MKPYKMADILATKFDMKTKEAGQAMDHRKELLAMHRRCQEIEHFHKDAFPVGGPEQAQDRPRYGFDKINPSANQFDTLKSDDFIKRFQLMARELDVNGEQALAVASQPVHDVFVRTFFKRLREFGQALHEAGVMEKNV